MRIVPFPADESPPGQEEWIAHLQAALSGSSQDPAAHEWRKLRADVRSLAPAMSVSFQESLAQRLERLGAIEPSAAPRPSDDAVHGSSSSPADSRGGVPGHASATPPPQSAPAPAPVKRPRAPARLRLAGWWLASHRRPLLATLGGASVVLVAALLVLSPGGPRSAIEAPPTRRTPTIVAVPDVAPSRASAGAGAAKSASSNAASDSATSAAEGSESSPRGPVAGASTSAAPGRSQQLAASLTLLVSPANLQTTSDRVTQLAVHAGGFVRSSDVQVQQQGTSEATIDLELPSAGLGAALAAIGRLAAVRAENQSVQDITDSVQAAHRQLGDAEAERRALLRALGGATTPARIDSLREQLVASRAAIARAQSSVNAVARRASTAEVEVSILGDARARSEGLTLHRGLHDAARVLLVALIVLVVAASGLVPLGLLLAATLAGTSVWRRYRRERALS